MKISVQEMREKLEALRKEWGRTPSELVAVLQSRGKAPKGKGSEFERAICKQLSLWWSEGQREDLFWRSSNSGGRATVRSRNNQSTAGHYGDVAATDPEGASLLRVFTIELKRGYSDYSFSDLLDKTDSAGPQVWEEFCKQVLEGTRASGSKSWMIIWRRDRRESLVFLPAKVIMRLMSFHPSNAQLSPFLIASIGVDTKPLRIFCCRLDKFLQAIKPDEVKRWN